MGDKERFKEKWCKWREAFNGDIPQSISNQIASMLLDYLTWSTISEARKLVADETNGEIINGMTHNFIDRSYVDSQAMQIRKLVDGASIAGTKSVYSLLSCIRHMKECKALITRENICFAEDIPLTTDDIKERKEHFISQQKSWVAFRIPLELDSDPIEERYRSIDLLCEVKFENRLSEDKLCLYMLNTIELKLTEGTKKVKNYVDKHVAHAATPDSITAAGMPLSPDLTFDDINFARDAICKGFVDIGNILYGTTQFQLVPSIPGDQFVAIDKPLVRKKDIETLREKWQKWEDDINSIAGQR